MGTRGDLLRPPPASRFPGFGPPPASPSSRGLGERPFAAGTRVRSPLGTPTPSRTGGDARRIAGTCDRASPLLSPPVQAFPPCHSRKAAYKDSRTLGRG